jgi:hypothetical protein
VLDGRTVAYLDYVGSGERRKNAFSIDGLPALTDDPKHPDER